MKYKALSKVRLIYLVLALMLLMVSLAPMAVAQEPEEEGDVNVAFTFHGPAELVPEDLVLDVGGGTTELVIKDIEDVYAADLAVDFPETIGVVPLGVSDVVPGDLPQNLIQGIDYQFTWEIETEDESSPCPILDPPGEPPVEIPVGYDRICIHIVLLGQQLYPLQGNGSLARIHWAIPAAPLAGPEVIYWQHGEFKDRDGNKIYPYNLAIGGDGVFPVMGDISTEPTVEMIRAQVSSEGNKPLIDDDEMTVSWRADDNPPYFSGAGFTDCPLSDAHFECGGIAMADLPVLVVARRPGYLPARATHVALGENLPDVRLTAGNVVESAALGDPCEIINIQDIAAIANSLNQLTLNGGGVAPDAMDFNYNSYVDIGDLALAAKNYGKRGSIDWRTGELTCP